MEERSLERYGERELVRRRPVTRSPAIPGAYSRNRRHHACPTHVESARSSRGVEGGGRGAAV